MHPVNLITPEGLLETAETCPHEPERFNTFIQRSWNFHITALMTHGLREVQTKLLRSRDTVSRSQ